NQLPLSTTLFPYTTLFRSGEFRQRFTQGRASSPHRGDTRAGPDVRARSPKCRSVALCLGGGRPPGLRFQRPAVLPRHLLRGLSRDRKSTRLNSSHVKISYA